MPACLLRSLRSVCAPGRHDPAASRVAALVVLVPLGAGCGLVLDLDPGDQSRASREARTDGGAGSLRDAKGDEDEGGIDATQPRDGANAPPEGGAPFRDANSSGTPCSEGAHCEDEIECTADRCVDGQCVHEPDDSICIAEDSEFRCTVDGCRTPTCVVGDTCVGGPCQNARCDGDLCIVESECSADQECCAGACVPLGCDDQNTCTDDWCGELGCENPATSTSDGCDNGVFCDGPDECRNGACLPFLEPPCGDDRMCNETARACAECVTGSDCPDPIVGTPSHCVTSGDPCSPDGTRTTTTTTFSCLGGRCVAEEMAVLSACLLDTDGRSCTDGQFCNGEETCRDGVCQPGSAPCTLSQDCDEALRACRSLTLTCDNALGCERACADLACLTTGGSCGCVDDRCGCVPNDT